MQYTNEQHEICEITQEQIFINIISSKGVFCFQIPTDYSIYTTGVYRHPSRRMYDVRPHILPCEHCELHSLCDDKSNYLQDPSIGSTYTAKYHAALKLNPTLALDALL